MNSPSSPPTIEQPRDDGEWTAARRLELSWLADRLRTVKGARGRITRRDRRQLLAGITDAGSINEIKQSLRRLFQLLELKALRWRAEPSSIDLPFIALLPSGEMRLVLRVQQDGKWVSESTSKREAISQWPAGTAFMAAHLPEPMPEEATARGVFRAIMRADRGWIYLSALASLLASILVLATSLYSMQVYDRVMTHGGVPTLIVLSAGVLIAILVELVLKIARSNIVERATHHIDLEFAHAVFAKLLRIRLDQFPGGVGSLAAQVRGFESARIFAVAATLFFVTDAPFALFFLAVIFLLGGPIVAAVPAIALVLALSGGMLFKNSVIRHSTRQNMVGNRRVGVLVETIQGLETLKSSGGIWRMLGRWNELSQQTSEESLQLKHLNDLSGYFAGTLQQLSYVALIATGAYLASTEGSLTSGAIVACSIISGRVLGAVSSMPNLLVQWAHARVALDNLEKLFRLEDDNHGLEAPLAPTEIRGDLVVSGLEFSYPGQARPFVVNSLHIPAGQRIAILGMIGTGKSTLLKLLAGLCKPERGQVLLDGMDLQQIALDVRSENIGYLPQQSRLFSGTLRENLTLGFSGIDEAAIVSACKITGLADVVATRPEGLDLRISEGGEGLSGGQKRQVSLTRLLLSRPRLWLLDEPTEGMDDRTEARCMAGLQTAIQPSHTLILVTHNGRMLNLVDRVVVLGPQGIVLDGPRNDVLAALRRPPGPPGNVHETRGAAAKGPVVNYS